MKTELYKGDCLEVMDRLIEEGVKVDAIITDPPYGMNYKSNRRVASEKFDYIKNDTNIDSLLSDSLIKSNTLLKDGSPIFIFCSWHNVDKFKAEFQKHFKLKNILVWNKNNHGTGDLNGSYAPRHEFILFGEKGRCIRNEGRKRSADVISYDKVTSKKLLHPTEKPVEMLSDFILDFVRQDGVVFDPFMGSGSTGVACVNNDRNFIGIELDENYFKIAEQRIAEACKE